MICIMKGDVPRHEDEDEDGDEDGDGDEDEDEWLIMTGGALR